MCPRVPFYIYLWSRRLHFVTKVNIVVLFCALLIVIMLSDILSIVDFCSSLLSCFTVVVGDLFLLDQTPKDFKVTVDTVPYSIV